MRETTTVFSDERGRLHIYTTIKLFFTTGLHRCCLQIYNGFETVVNHLRKGQQYFRHRFEIPGDNGL